MFGKKKIAMLVAEFLGTGVLTLVVLAVQRSTIGIPYFVALAAGLAVGTLTLLLAGASGAHINPAVTFGALAARKIKPVAAALYIVVQLLGAWFAYFIYTIFVNSSFPTIGGHFSWRIFTAEAVGAFIFVFLWAAVAAQKLSGAFVGAAFALGILIASITSLGLINPAVAVGTRAWAVFGGWMGWWTYLAAPLLGGLVGYNLWDLLFTNGAAVSTRAASSTVASTSARKTTTRKTTAKKSGAKRR